MLALNAGSASHIARLFQTTAEPPLEPVVPLWSNDVESREVGFAQVLDGLPDGRLDAVAHRVVHGGVRQTELAARIDERVERAIEDARIFAPRHNGLALDGIAAARERLPDVPQIAVFDHAFDGDAPRVAVTLALPHAVRERYHLRRIGFHGISHRDVVLRAAERLGRDDARVVTVHLGSGCSIAAFDGVRLIETTMGLTPLEGLVMGARSGSVDPGTLIYLLRRGMPLDELDTMLNSQAGLLGLSGRSLDTRDVIAAMDAGDDAAALAFACYTYRVGVHIGALAAALGGLDAISFSGPVGEHMPRVRAAACERLGFMAVALDAAANGAAKGGSDAEIGACGAPVRTFVFRTLEEWAMIRRTAALLR